MKERKYMLKDAELLKDAENISLDVLMQACGINNEEIDNRCISAYERACVYLEMEAGKLKTKNGRIYEIVR